LTKVILTDITTGYGSTTKLNANFDLIQDEFDNTLSRDGSTPNGMLANLDMNSQRILNLPSATSNTEPVTYAQFSSALGTLSAQGYLIEEQTATAAQTVFTLAGITYTPGSGNLGVYINGVRQHPAVYSQTSSSVVTFSSPGAFVGDKVLFEVLSLTESADIIPSNLVTHISAGSGAVATTAREKFRETVSVKDFGAIGDGSADDSGQVEAALTYLAGTGRTLFFPAGTYKFTRQQLFHRVRCIGDNAILKFTGLGASTDCLILQGSTREFPLELSGFTIDANSTGRDALVCSGGKSGSTQADFLKISGVLIKGAVRDGIHIEPSLAANWLEDFHLSEIRVYNSGRHGICIIQPNLATTFINQGLFTNVEVRGSGQTTTGYEVYVEAQGTVSGQKVSELTFVNCEFDASGASTHGIHSVYLNMTGSVSDLDGWVFLGCTFEDVGNAVPGKTYAIGISTSTTVRNPQVIGGVMANYTGVIDTAKISSGRVSMSSGNINFEMLGTDTKLRWGNGATDTMEWEEAGYLKTTSSFQVAALREKRSVLTAAAGAITVARGFNKHNLTANITTITFPTGTATNLDGQLVRIQFTQDATGGRTVAGWPATVLLAGGAFTPTATAYKTSHIEFIYERGEARWYEVARSLNI